MSSIKLSEGEQAALQAIKNAGGMLLVSQISDSTDRDVFGNVVPGMRVFNQTHADQA